ncbi:MAG: hypothetical protein AB7F99_04220 [Vicinamibacterales bacterium]
MSHSSELGQTQGTRNVKKEAKRAYQTLHLREYGHVREMTKTTIVGAYIADGGTPPNIYTS